MTVQDFQICIQEPLDVPGRFSGRRFTRLVREFGSQGLYGLDMFAAGGAGGNIPHELQDFLNDAPVAGHLQGICLQGLAQSQNTLIYRTLFFGHVLQMAPFPQCNRRRYFGDSRRYFGDSRRYFSRCGETRFRLLR
jgi:hypothetical protein